MRLYYDSDADIQLIRNKKIAIIGYGSQGRAHARNLRDSGIDDIIIILKKDSNTCTKVIKDGFKLGLLEEQDFNGIDFIMMLAPDESQPQIYYTSLHNQLKQGAIISFAHGLCVHFNLIEPRDDLDVIMIAPKGPGHNVRNEYVKGNGVPCLIAIKQNVSGNSKNIALSYAVAIGGGRAGIIETTFREECETDLFGEQAVLCGGLVALIRAGYEVLIEAGYSPEMAYFECLHEVKLIVDLIYEGGISNMLCSISNTAEYGSYISGPRLINTATKVEMKRILNDIQSGKFTRDWILENKAYQSSFKANRRLSAEHSVEKIGFKLRAMMPWTSTHNLINKDKN